MPSQAHIYFYFKRCRRRLARADISHMPAGEFHAISAPTRAGDAQEIEAYFSTGYARRRGHIFEARGEPGRGQPPRRAYFAAFLMTRLHAWSDYGFWLTREANTPPKQPRASYRAQRAMPSADKYHAAASCLSFAAIFIFFDDGAAEAAAFSLRWATFSLRVFGARAPLPCRYADAFDARFSATA